MNLVPLVETTRGLDLAGATVENRHFGAVAVVDLAGRVRYYAGDPHYLCFTRSALKPLQALPLIEDQGLEQLGLDAADLALICASHSGEPAHVARVEQVLARLGLGESDLQCGCQVPVYYSTMGIKAPSDVVWRQVHHNCSGKHTGMLAWCRVQGHDHARYLDFDHPLQQRIRAALGRHMGIDLASCRAGIDGCSAPNYALPLSRLAHFYARIAADPSHAVAEPALTRIFEAMTGHPHLVSGEGRTDLAYMSCAPADWIAKAGADGVQVLASRQRGLALAVKIADGSARALHTAVVGVLDALGWSTERSRELTAPWREPLIRNFKGLTVGSMRCCIDLCRAD